MKKEIHTPSPWEVDEVGLAVVSKSEHPVNHKEYRRGFCVFSNSSLPLEIRQANVALAARAPELLAENERLRQRVKELEELCSKAANSVSCACRTSDYEVSHCFECCDSSDAACFQMPHFDNYKKLKAAGDEKSS